MYSENFQILKSIKVEKKVRKFTEKYEIHGKTEKFAEKWKNFTEKVNNLGLTIYDVIIRGQFFQHRQVSGPVHSLEKFPGPETAYSILLQSRKVAHQQMACALEGLLGTASAQASRTV